MLGERMLGILLLARCSWVFQHRWESEGMGRHLSFASPCATSDSLKFKVVLSTQRWISMLCFNPILGFAASSRMVDNRPGVISYTIRKMVNGERRIIHMLSTIFKPCLSPLFSYPMCLAHESFPAIYVQDTMDRALSAPSLYNHP